MNSPVSRSRPMRTQASGPSKGTPPTVRAAEAAMKDADLGEGVTYAFSGENESIMEAIQQLLLMLLLGVLLVVIFGVWGTNYDAQAFIYFQF